MIQTYQGYFQNGYFIPRQENIKSIPDNMEVYVVVTEKIILPLERKRMDKRAIFESLKGILPPDTDLEEARDERIRKRGLVDA
jgi:hypothetical protein